MYSKHPPHLKRLEKNKIKLFRQALHTWKLSIEIKKKSSLERLSLESTLINMVGKKKKKPPDSFHFQSFALHLTLHLKISEESSKETGV